MRILIHLFHGWIAMELQLNIQRISLQRGIQAKKLLALRHVIYIYISKL